MLIYYFLAAASAVVLVVLGARLARARADDEPDGPTAGHVGSMLSALFLVSFAIAIVVPWTSTDAARLNTQAEGQALAEASWAAGGLPAADADQIRVRLRDYAEFVRVREWPLMAQGRLSPEGWQRLEALRRQTMALEVKDDAANARDEVAAHLAEVTAARRQRATDAQTGTPSGVLLITVLTGLAVLFYPLMAGARPRRMVLVSLAVMAAMLGVGVYLTFGIAHSFGGVLAVKPEAFDRALAELQRIAAGG